MSKYSIDDLDDDYVKYLYLKIPILQEKNKYNVELLQLVLDYIESTSKKVNYFTYLIFKKSPKNILEESFKNIIGHKKNIENNKKKFSQTNNKYEKIYNIKVLALIESIILVTLNYYEKKNKNKNIIFPNTKIEITNSMQNVNTKEIKFVMNKVKDIDLGNYILNLYKRDDIDSYQKETITFNLLQKIAKKLQYLQDNFSFIHGDFHSGNIFVKENNNNDIKFIDVEYSTIKLPTKKIVNKTKKNVNKTIILTSPLNENISRKEILNINKEPNLKALDLFHLIQDIKSFDNLNTIKKINSVKMKQLITLITKLSELYKIPCKLSSKLHNSTRESRFFNDNYSNLIPENFIKILNINNLKIESPKRNLTEKRNNNPSTPKKTKPNICYTTP